METLHHEIVILFPGMGLATSNVLMPLRAVVDGPVHGAQSVNGTFAVRQEFSPSFLNANTPAEIFVGRWIFSLLWF
jgi:hypothetical protein